ncbi:hypothetical protein CACET_c27660 [Clostridium aceticum]|uniref:Uncharacterized protein n=1 Tax=Clostridium aceticum TaxID=84022 RepID=A0A0D8I992_9CLOT|nr:hypothetical protein [Clostridium aceticum]AKL96211.1 hypothetical protein CACET_c27660 [Clostridium aceticum]KJF26624.1 hypothetical protein TZ02_12190 [Clostridium aceticum]
MTKARKKPTITLELTKEIFTGDNVHLFIQDKVIDINGIIPDHILNQTIGGRKDTMFIIKQVNDEQIANLKEQLNKIVSLKGIKELEKIQHSSVESKIEYQRLKAIIVYKNSIFRIKRLSILKKEDGSHSVIFGIA